MSKKIITMDDPGFHIVQFAHPNSSGWNGKGYYPKIKGFKVTDEYLDLLEQIAREQGINPDTIEIVGLERMRKQVEFYGGKPRYP